jgi:hypothetical protein
LLQKVIQASILTTSRVAMKIKMSVSVKDQNERERERLN